MLSQHSNLGILSHSYFKNKQQQKHCEVPLTKKQFMRLSNDNIQNCQSCSDNENGTKDHNRILSTNLRILVVWPINDTKWCVTLLIFLYLWITLFISIHWIKCGRSKINANGQLVSSDLRYLSVSTNYHQQMSFLCLCARARERSYLFEYLASPFLSLLC